MDYNNDKNNRTIHFSKLTSKKKVALSPQPKIKSLQKTFKIEPRKTSNLNMIFHD